MNIPKGTRCDIKARRSNVELRSGHAKIWKMAEQNPSQQLKEQAAHGYKKKKSNVKGKSFQCDRLNLKVSKHKLTAGT